MPTQDPGPVGRVVDWKLTKGRGNDIEERTYEQRELSIEGEARLLGMARQIGVVLKESDVNLAQFSDMVKTGNPDWQVIFDALTLIVEHAPRLLAETVLTLLGIFPTLDDGSPNTKYDDDVKFIRATVNTAKVHDMARVFVEQNEYERIARPFWNRFVNEAESEPTESTRTGASPA